MIKTGEWTLLIIENRMNKIINWAGDAFDCDKTIKILWYKNYVDNWKSKNIKKCIYDKCTDLIMLVVLCFLPAFISII